MEHIKGIVNRHIFKNIAFILLGCVIIALGINLFIVHANLLSGGAAGIALIFQYIFGLSAGYTVLIINIPLLIISYFLINKRFAIFTAIGTLGFSVALILTAPLKDLIRLDDILLLCIYGGVLSGLGGGIVLSNHGSTGGVDILTALLKKKHDNFDIGTISFVMNLIIVSISIFFFGLTKALYTLVSMYISSMVVDKVIKGLDRQKLIMIITSKENEVSKIIIENVHRGVTFLYGEGAYTGERRNVLYCIVSLSQVPIMKQIVKSVDAKSFMSILDVSEVEGRGFKKYKF